MKILVIAHYAGTPSIGMEYRHYYLAKEWQKSGHEVLLVSASFTHLRSVQFQLKNNIEKREVDGIEFLVLKTPSYKKNNYRRVINILVFTYFLFLKTKEIAKLFKPDIVIASSTYNFEIFSAKKLAKISGAKLIYDVRDLWPLALVELGGYSKWHPSIIMMQISENFAYRHSDKVVSVLPQSFEYMKEHGLQAGKFTYIPNGIFIEGWNTECSVPEKILQLILSRKKINNKIIAYTGNHGVANALVFLVKAMQLLENEKVDLIMIGQGAERDNLIQISNDLELKNVYFIPTVSKFTIPGILNLMDILYIGLQNQPVFRFGISPNKLFDYMMAGKPIIQAVKAGNDLVADAKCGISIEPENPSAIAEAVKYLLSLPEEDLNQMGQNGKKYCIANHDYRILAKKYLKEFE